MAQGMLTVLVRFDAVLVRFTAVAVVANRGAQSSRKVSVSRSFPTYFEIDRRFLSCSRSIRPTRKRPVHTIKLSSHLFSDE